MKKLFALTLCFVIMACTVAFCDETYHGWFNGIYVVCTSSNKIEVYNSDDELLETVNGTGPVYRVDEYRFVFTSCTKGSKKRRPVWHGVSVFEIFTDGEKPNEFLVTPVIEPTETEDYTAGGYAGDDDECIVIKESVEDPKEWGKPDSMPKTEKINMPMPAAG